jgi:K+-sensing histidine kinase KdpD
MSDRDDATGREGPSASGPGDEAGTGDGTQRSGAVLLVDDEPAGETRLRHHVRSDGFRLETRVEDLTRVETVDAALSTLSTGEYDALLLSFELDGRDGLTALEQVLDAEPGVPVVVLTGREDHAVGEAAVRRGAQDYLVRGALDGRRLSRTLGYAVQRHCRSRELERRTRELRRQTEQLEFFSAVLRHDIYNGMNVIEGRTELLRDELDEGAEAHADAVLEWSDSLIDLTEKVQAVLDTITDGAERDRRPVALAPLVDREAERVRAMDGDLTVDVDVPDDAAVLADDLLADVIGNLLTNSVEHNEPAGLTVSVTATVEGDTVTLRVDDDGAGLPTTDPDALFERGETAGAAGGSCFGLYLVASMVEAYGGDVRAVDDGAGATFVLELPAA